MKSARLPLQAMAALGLILLGSGCATNRGILDVRIVPGPNTQSQKAVTIAQVKDLRQFELKPDRPSIPSLRDDQINNKAITSRAIARKRNTYGKALGDILLPEGRAVEDLARECVEKALREKGYRVVSDGGTAGPDAVPLEVEIRQFWAWMTPGFWAIKLEFEAVLDIKSPVLRSGGSETVRGYALRRTQFGTGGAWKKTIQQGTDNLIEEVKKSIKEP